MFTVKGLFTHRSSSSQVKVNPFDTLILLTFSLIKKIIDKFTKFNDWGLTSSNETYGLNYNNYVLLKKKKIMDLI